MPILAHSPPASKGTAPSPFATPTRGAPNGAKKQSSPGALTKQQLQELSLAARVVDLEESVRNTSTLAENLRDGLLQIGDIDNLSNSVHFRTVQAIQTALETNESLLLLQTAADDTLPALQRKVEALETALEEQKQANQRLQRRLELFMKLPRQQPQQQQLQQHQQQQPDPFCSHLVVYAPANQQDGIRQAVATAASCDLEAVRAVFTLPTREKQPTESEVIKPTAAAAAAAAAATTGDDDSRPAAAGTSGGGAAAQGARGDKQRAIPHVVIVSCKEVKLAAIRGKSSLKHKAPGFYLEPRRNQQQQRLYKQMRAVWTDLRRKGSDTRWVRDGNGVEVGLERRVGKEGPWQRVAMPTKQDAAERGPPAQPAAAKPPQPAAAAAAIPPPRGSKDGKSQKQRQRSQSTAARGRSSTRQQHQNEAAASRGKGKQREQQQQQAMQQAAAADGAAVRKEAGSRATTGAAGKGKAIGNSNTCEIEPASPT